MGQARRYILQCDWIKPSGVTTVTGTSEYSLLSGFTGTSIFDSGSTFSYLGITAAELSDLTNDDYQTRVTDFISYISQFEYSFNLYELTTLIDNGEYNEVLCIATTTTTVAPITTTTTTNSLTNYTVALTDKEVSSPSPNIVGWTYQIETTPPLVSGDEIDVTFYFSGYTDGTDAGIGLTIENASIYLINSGVGVIIQNVNNTEWANYPNPPLNPITGSGVLTLTGSSSIYEIRVSAEAIGTAGSTYIAENEFYMLGAVGSAGNVGVVTINNSETSKFSISGTL